MGEAFDGQNGTFRFEGFHLDPGNRRLMKGGVPVEVSARYLDALTLLVREQGQLVSKDRFMDEVWRGVPVTDEALTQCIRTLRRQLGDDASAPRFVETVPKHGYRFIAPVEAGERTSGTQPVIGSGQAGSWQWALLGGAGTLGGALAGLIGGLFYGFGGATIPAGPGMGGTSVLLVLTMATVAVAIIGAAGVSFGISGAAHVSGSPWRWAPLGGAVGGLLVGAIVKLLGVDAFNLLFGQSPGDITGAPEGLVLGGAVGLGAWLAGRWGVSGLRKGASVAAAAGALAGAAVSLLGGNLMGGSLNFVAETLPGSRLTLAPIGALFGEQGFGRVSHFVTSVLEGALFGGCVVAFMVLGRRTIARD